MECDPIHILGGGLSGLAGAIVLANAGREVHVHELRADSGARFDGDFQALENWTGEDDPLDQMSSWGLNPMAFKSTPFCEMDVADPDDSISKIKMPSVGFRIVERGTGASSIDQGFKRTAEAAGVTIHFRSKRSPSDCSIIATGPSATSAFALGEVFRTSHPNHVTFHLNDKLAPGAYTYMLIVGGIGIICTCLWRKQRETSKFLNETIAWYERHYPDLDREPLKRVAGKGNFAICKRYATRNQLYTGEAAGLQDFLWGFGIRYAVHSGVLAAMHCLGECDYNTEVKHQLLPGVQASAVNRFLFNRIGDRGYRFVIRHWLAKQAATGDGLAFVRALYKPTFLRRLLYLPVSLCMLKAARGVTGSRMRRLPHKAAIPRDTWTPSREADDVRRRWNEQRKLREH